MPPKGQSWKELTWSWAYSTGRPASDQVLEAAASAAWPYALLCAWTYLNDRDSAVDLMDHAVQNASQYLLVHSDPTPAKLTSRIKSVLRRRARYLVARRSREVPVGSIIDLEELVRGEPVAEIRVYAYEVLEHLSPFAQTVVRLRWHGYTWRAIAKRMEMDHTAVRRAYLRELKAVLPNMSRPGESLECD